MRESSVTPCLAAATRRRSGGLLPELDLSILEIVDAVSDWPLTQQASYTVREILRLVFPMQVYQMQ